MKKLTLFIQVIIFAATVCNAQKIWSVSKDASQNADFSEIQAAINAASSGDYIYVYSGTYQNGFTLGTPLIILGPGYFLGDNENTQQSKSPATILGKVIIEGNTSGSVISGLSIKNNMTISNASNVKIKKNNISSIDIHYSTNIAIKQNYIDEPFCYSCSSNYHDVTPLRVANNSSQINISNNFIVNYDLGYGIFGENSAVTILSPSSATVNNNVIFGNIVINYTSFANNIVLSGEIISSYKSSLTNNISCNSSLGDYSGNLSNVSKNSLFVGVQKNPSLDGRWQLAKQSPAIGAGVDGVDCGMFGGTSPYVLSGLPSIPTIYYFDAPDGTNISNGLQINLKVKTR